MKKAIAQFITDHPFLSFLLADAAVVNGCKMVVTLLRGYPTETRMITTQSSDDTEAVDDNATSE